MSFFLTRKFTRRFVVITGVLVVVALGLWINANYIQETQVTFTVSQTTANHGGQYLIYTNRGTFTDGDNLFHTKFASSDLFAQIKPGHTYTCRVTGFRVPLFSWYQNIIGCDGLKG